jgi:hypothetical protein
MPNQQQGAHTNTVTKTTKTIQPPAGKYNVTSVAVTPKGKCWFDNSPYRTLSSRTRISSMPPGLINQTKLDRNGNIAIDKRGSGVRNDFALSATCAQPVPNLDHPERPRTFSRKPRKSSSAEENRAPGGS